MARSLGRMFHRRGNSRDGTSSGLLTGEKDDGGADGASSSSAKPRSSSSLAVCFFLAVLVVFFYATKGDTSSTVSSLYNLSATDSSSPNRELKLSDLTFKRFLGHGQATIVLVVELPDWWIQQEQENNNGKHSSYYTFTDSQEYVIKILDSGKKQAYGSREIEAFQRMNAAALQEPEKARRMGVLPLVMGEVDLPNPYHCSEGEDAYECLPLPDHIASKYGERLRAPKRIDVEVLPMAEQIFIFDKERTMEEYIIFFRSLLEQLAFAHKVGVNCQDLNPYSNYFFNPETGGAVMFDWNEWKKVGEEAYEWNRGLHYSPPEGFAQRIHGKDMRLYQSHTVDIWQMGLVWVHILFHPCAWFSNKLVKEEDLLKQNILTIGGNTIAPMNDKEDVDLAKLAGLSSEDVENVKFRVLLGDKFKGKNQCEGSSWYLERPDTPTEKKTQAIDLLQQMLKLSPYDRPTADELLKHPFLN